MNTLQTILVAVCASGGAACFLFSLAYRFRNELRKLHERWLKMSPLSRAMCILALSVAVLYGGTKPPSSTNEPPSDIEGNAPATTNEPPEIVDSDPAPTNQPPPVLMARRLPSVALAKDGPRLVLSAPPQQTVPNNLCSPSPSTFTSLTAWNKRGAYCDWLHITFPDSFEFPHGTNLLTGVTLMAYGELRENLHCSTSTSPFALPTRVSLVPGESSCVYGLTPSNSFLFSWSNVCVNRDPTNRVDASIELFDSGACSVRFDTVETFYPAQPPPGFVGSNQDDAWLAAAFSPTDFAAITNLGYSAWLTDHVGHNEPNGRYKLSVTIAALPDHGPCYLVCGPYKMIVTSPGTYSFPLIDMTEYDLYTCPTAVPLTWEMDDGWDLPEPSYSPLFMSPAPRMLGAPRNDDNHYKIERYPSVFVEPNYLTREEAINELIRVRCNAAGIASRDYRSMSGQAVVLFNQSEAIIRESLLQDEIYFYYRHNGREVCGTLYISSDYWWWWHDPDPTNGTSNVTSTNDNASTSNP